MKICVAIASSVLLMLCGCRTDVDRRVVGVDTSWMDTTVRPGDDFYRYACGGWCKSHAIPQEFSAYGVNEVLAERNNANIRTIISELLQSDKNLSHEAQMIADACRLYLDTARQNAEGYSAIKADMDQIEAIADRRQLMTVMAENSLKGALTLVNVNISVDYKDSQRYLAFISSPCLQLGAGNRDFYLSSDSSLAFIRSKYREHIVDMFLLSGCDSLTATGKMNNIMDLEIRMARSTRSVVELNDVEKSYNKLSYSQLLAQYPDFEWDRFMSQCYIDSVDCVNVGQPETLREAIAILNTAPLQQVKDWLQWSYLEASASLIGREFFDAEFSFHMAAVYGIERPFPIEKRVVDFAESMFSMAVGKLYVERYFPEANKQRMMQLVTSLQKALLTRIDAQTWMDPATKQKAKDKVSAFHFMIGYPDVWPTYDGLVIDKSKSLVYNVHEIARWSYFDHVRRRLNKPVDRYEWDAEMPPQEINAQYDQTANTICFPAGILQPPFFDMEADDAFNYGDIGVTIGHEMTHAFDNVGCMFDINGNLNGWWTENDYAEFNRRTKVFVDYFNSIEALPGVHINGELVLGENIADHGGLKVAWLAYKEATRDNPLPDKDGLTADQRFFISYAFTWAENCREEHVRSMLENNEHALPVYRTNGCLPHFDPWYEAFGVREGDKLYLPKEQRADIW